MKIPFAKTVFTFLAAFLWPCFSSASDKVSIYIAAHQDDWQLFMGVNAYNDIAGSSASSRVVIIYVTAGDYKDCLSQAVPFYLAREQGAKNSVELAANSYKERFTWNKDTLVINNHLLIRSSYRSVTCYFLCLPDGGRDGERKISLKNFRENRFANNYSIDSLSYYRDWNDLSRTCDSIFRHEIKNADDVWLNVFDTSQIINPGDHSDHYESALLFLQNKISDDVKVKLFEGYSSARADRLANLDDVGIMKESGLFAAYNQAMMDNHYPSVWNKDYIRCCDNNYFRIVSGEQQQEVNRRKVAIGTFILFVLVIGLTFYYLLKRK